MIEGNRSPLAGSGNLFFTPLFLSPDRWDDGGTSDPLDDSFIPDNRFRHNSPAINAGSAAAAPPPSQRVAGWAANLSLGWVESSCPKRRYENAQPFNSPFNSSRRWSSAGRRSSRVFWI